MELEETILDNYSIQFKLLKNNQKLTFFEWLSELNSSKEFRTEFTELLKKVSFEAYFFETPGMIVQNLNSDFEFTLIKNSSLEKW